MAADDDLILDLLERWEDARAAGTDLSAEELCRDRPDLIEIVRAKIAALRASDWMRPEPPTAARPRVLAGRYRLERLVGQGGYGQVWRAYDEVLHRPVAIKVPQAVRRLGERQIDQLLTEARRVGGLRHPDIVAVHDVLKEGAAYVIVADFIDGQDLADRLGRGPLPTTEAVRITARVARVLDYAHGQGVIHRDIKPSNVLLSPDGGVHVCDFGIAATRQELLDRPDRRATLAYASPEQLGDGPVDHRTDIWSLGILLFEMLTGRRPFDADDPVRFQQQIRTAAPPAMPGVPEPLAAVCRRCLAKRPEERFTSGADVARALEVAQASRPRRWPVLLVVIGLLAVTAFGMWYVLRTRPTPEPVAESPKQVGEVGVEPPSDRADAEWVLSRGGKVRLPDGRADLVVATPDALPAGPWGLDGVIFEGAKLDDAMISRVARMRSLRTLHLGGSNVTTAHLTVLKQGLRLRTLGVNWVGLTDDQLEVIADFPGLEELDMSGAKVTAAGVRHLRRATSLRDLAVNGVTLTPEVVAELGQLKQLRKIYLGVDEVVARRELKSLLPECQLIPPSKPPILPARVLEGHTTPIRAVQFRADGEWLASADEKTLRLWPPAGEAVTLGMPSPPTAMVFGPNGWTVFTGHEDGVVRHWWVGARTPREHAAAWASLEMSPDWGRLTLMPFTPLSNSPSLIRSWPGDGSPVQAVAIAPSGKWAAWTTRNKLHVWDAVSNRTATPLNKPDTATVALFFLPDTGFAPDELLMSGWHNGPERKADLLQWKPLPLADGLGLSPRGRMQNFGLMKGVQHVTADPDFKLIVATLDGGLAAFSKAADAPGFHLVGQLGHTMPGVRRTAILPGAARTLSFGEDGTLCLWEPKSQTQKIVSDPHPMPVTDVAVSPDGTLAATGCRDSKVRVWRLTEGK